MPARRVYVLQDNLYDDTLSVHATWAEAEAAIERYLAGEVTEQAKGWWDNFGTDSEFVKKYGHKPKAKTLKQHIAEEVACAKENLHIVEYELS